MTWRSRRLMALAAGVCAVLVCVAVRAADVGEPTHADVRYSKAYERSVLDVWLPEKAEAPVPLVVYFHGGSFKVGDKKAFRRHPVLRQNAKEQVAFASVNYPLLPDATYLEIMTHAGEAIRFLKAQAEAWNIDPTRIAVSGSSAGAMIAEYVTYVLDLGITACYAESQPYKSWFLLAGIKKGSAPLLLYTHSSPKDVVHHPDHAKRFKAHCDAVGVPCEIYGSEASGLPQLPAEAKHATYVLTFFRKVWEADGT